jgi:hypothetical protein
VQRWLSVVVLLAACGSNAGSDAGSGVGSSATCESACAAIVTPGCPAESLATCDSRCHAWLDPALATCPKVVGQYLACGRDQLRGCDADPGEAPPACASQTYALRDCTACMPEQYDSPCITCLKTSCCGAWKAGFGDPAYDAFSSCMAYCQDAACAKDCAQQYPSGAAETNAINACQSANCPQC